jgi:putative flippase GtrA
LFRYAGVSAVSTTVSLTVLLTLVATDAVSSGWANVIATAVGTVPSFELNRRCVWRRSGSRSMGTEVVPFFGLSFLSLAISTLAVSRATAWASEAGFDNVVRVWLAVGANLGSFGTMWVVQYLVLDRFLFRDRSRLTS